jgi:N-methylhydantoinase B
MSPVEGATSPRLMSVLAAQCRAISSHMSNALLRAARSGVISSARDFSSVLLLGDGRPLVIDEGLPVHVGGAHLAIQAVMQSFDDIEEGDCFLNNSPFMGNTHHADFTLCAPVFYDDELLFWVVSRAHQADVGAPIPSTYLPFAATVQEEGIHFPCVRVRRGGTELRDVIRILTEAVRVPELCYADYLAQVGALRVGEQRLIELCDKYSSATIKAFCDEWLAYGDRMMASAIAALPAAEWRGETRHDPVSFAPEGIPVRATLKIDPEEKRITVDLLDNVDNVAGGLNLTHATTLAAVYGGILNNIGPSVPRNAGSLARIDVLLREGAVVGIPARGVGTSVATTNLCDRLFNLIQSLFARGGSPYGIAEGSCGGPPSFGVISGRDLRTDGSYYVNQTIIGFGGGPAVHGHDGWLTYNKAVTGGALRIDSVEINEQRFPIIYDAIELVLDTAGAGTWNGAPSVRTQFGPRHTEMKVAYYGDAGEFPPQGVVGGHAGGPSAARKRLIDGSVVRLPSMGVESLDAGERIESTWSGGGGYGDPLQREPDRVARDVEEGLTSVTRAREVYGVALSRSEGGRMTVDVGATRRLRRLEAAERQDP